MSKTMTGARMAAMAAAFAASSFAIGADMPAGKAMSANDMVQCYGVTSCKGQTDCKTAENACKGQNACKGHGFKNMKAADCKAAKGTIGASK
jgi:hypothetical protein